jgi:hypothetical protein
VEVKKEEMVAQEAEEKAQVQEGEEWVEVEEDVMREGDSAVAGKGGGSGGGIAEHQCLIVAL